MKICAIFKKYKFDLNLFTFTIQYKFQIVSQKMHDFFEIPAVVMIQIVNTDIYI